LGALVGIMIIEVRVYGCVLGLVMIIVIVMDVLTVLEVNYLWLLIIYLLFLSLVCVCSVCGSELEILGLVIEK